MACHGARAIRLKLAWASVDYVSAMSPTRSRTAVLRLPELWIPPERLIALIWTASLSAYGLYLLALVA
jgi:hypothetical protein